MLNWAVTLLIVALIAALVGMTGVAAVATDIGGIIFIVSIVLFLASGVFGRGAPR